MPIRKMTYTGGGQYTGQFKKGKRHGVGIYTLPVGSIQAGYFHEGEYLG